MSLKKTAKQDAPHATFTLERAGWEWRVLKTYKAPAGEAKDQYARWFVAATSPMMQPPGEFEMGDTYKAEILGVHPALVSCTQEFKDAYPELVNIRTTITDAPTPADTGSPERILKFDAWMKSVNRFISAEVGIDSDDLPDQPYRDFYDEGRDPHEVARDVLAEEGYEA